MKRTFASNYILFPVTRLEKIELVEALDKNFWRGTEVLTQAEGRLEWATRHMVEEIKIFGKNLALPAIRGWGWRACRILFGARVRRFVGLWRFSEAENLLYLLVKRDAYLMTSFFALIGLSAPRIRQLQREKKRAAHADGSVTLNEVAATAAAIAHEFCHAVVSTEHLLLALLRQDDDSAHLLRDYALTYEGVAEVVSRHGLSSLYIELRLPRPKFYTSKIR